MNALLQCSANFHAKLDARKLSLLRKSGPRKTRHLAENSAKNIERSVLVNYVMRCSELIILWIRVLWASPSETEKRNFLEPQNEHHVANVVFDPHTTHLIAFAKKKTCAFNSWEFICSPKCIAKTFICKNMESMSVLNADMSLKFIHFF